MRRFASALSGLICAAALVSSPVARADCLGVELLAPEPPAPIPELGPNAAGPTTNDRSGRVIAPVFVNGQGPFRFLVDTGANRSAVTPRLVERLGLPPAGVGEVHSVHEMVVAPLVHVNGLSYGGVPLTSGRMPNLGGEVLADLDGLLGTDALHGRLLRIDFDQRCLEIAPARRASLMTGCTQLPAQKRSEDLILTQGRIQDQRINIVIDTGSDSTFANIALRDQLSLRARPERDPMRAYTAGRPVILNSALLIPSIVLGDVTARNIVAYVGDFHIFQYWQLQQVPTLLIGMDVLSQARALAIDYERGIVCVRVRTPRED